MNTLLNIVIIAILHTPIVVKESFRAVSKRDTTINYLVIHNDSSPDPKTTFRFLKKKHNSYHYYIDRSGIIHKLIDPKYQANHAGLSRYDGRSGLNKYSIGICLENLPPSPYRDSQYRSLAWLVVHLQNRFPDSRSRQIIGHETIAWPRGRKPDPGSHFDWQLLNGYIELYKQYDGYKKQYAEFNNGFNYVGIVLSIPEMGQLPMAVETAIY